MNARRLTTLVLLGSTLSLAGCGLLKKKTPEPAASVAVTPSAAPTTPLVAPPPEPAPVAPVVALDEATVPAPQDFEDEAFEKVTTANFKTELARLTKEITKPPVTK